MGVFILRKAGAALIVVFLASIVVFAGVRALPGDPALAFASENRVVIIDIDEASLSAVGAWPWPRARVADLAEMLVSHYEARAVGLDIVFPAAADPAGDERLAALGGIAPLVFAQALDFVPRIPAATAGTLVTRTPASLHGVKGALATGYLANHAGLSDVRCVGNIGLQPDPDGVVRNLKTPSVKLRGRGERNVAATPLPSPALP